jgi:hypothetical protein
MSLSAYSTLILLACSAIAVRDALSIAPGGRNHTRHKTGARSLVQSKIQKLTSLSSSALSPVDEPTAALVSSQAPVAGTTDAVAQTSAQPTTLNDLFNLYGRTQNAGQYVAQLMALGLEYSASLEDITHILPISLAPDFDGSKGNPQFLELELSDFTVRANLNGTSDGNGRIAYTWQNGTVVYQMPFSAPMVPKSLLQERLKLLKLIDASSTAAFLLNQTAPTVRHLLGLPIMQS